MGYRSDVTIMCEEDAYALFEKAIKNGGLMPAGISRIKIRNRFCYYLNWHWVKWYESYPEIAAIDQVCRELQEKDEEYEGYGFKKILIGEDNATEEYCNDTGLDLFDEFYIITDFNIPLGEERQTVYINMEEGEKE